MKYRFWSFLLFSIVLAALTLPLGWDKPETAEGRPLERRSAPAPALPGFKPAGGPDAALGGTPATPAPAASAADWLALRQSPAAWRADAPGLAAVGAALVAREPGSGLPRVLTASALAAVRGQAAASAKTGKVVIASADASNSPAVGGLSPAGTEKAAAAEEAKAKAERARKAKAAADEAKAAKAAQAKAVKAQAQTVSRAKAKAAAPMIDVGPGELDMLAKVIYAEARGESYEGQVAVGAVVVNRVMSSRFPDTIREVILQPGAFTAVSDGQYRLKPNATAYRAAKEALQGADPTGDAIYYYNPDTATSRWIRTRPTTADIGHHRFAR